MGLDELLFSLLPLRSAVVEGEATRLVSGPLLFRRVGRPPFDDRACRLVHLAVQESGALHVDGLNEDLGGVVAGLTPRRHSVLALLLHGMSPADVASGLELPPHTVAGHVAAIHRHFGVASHAELLQRCGGGSPGEGSHG